MSDQQSGNVEWKIITNGQAVFGLRGLDRRAAGEYEINIDTASEDGWLCGTWTTFENDVVCGLEELAFKIVHRGTIPECMQAAEAHAERRHQNQIEEEDEKQGGHWWG